MEEGSLFSTLSPAFIVCRYFYDDQSEVTPHCSFDVHGWRSLVGYSPRGHKEPDTTEQARILRLLFKTGMLYLKHLLLLLSHFSRVRLCATP